MKDSFKPGKCLYNKMNVPRKWSQLSYAGECRVPPPEDPSAWSWPTYYLSRNDKGDFTDCEGNVIAFRIRVPDSSIDFQGRQLDIVKETIRDITRHQIRVAKYWGDGPATKQWTPIIDRLIDTYGLTAPKAGRVLAATQGAINDAFVVSWYFKYLWEVARPNQFDQRLATILCTPRHPTYPSGHATVAGCAQIVLSYFFKPESDRLKELAEECAISRLYAGVHFPIDNCEGLSLGRQIGEIVVNKLSKEYDNYLAKIDYEIYYDRHAHLPPPPYRQAIPFDRDDRCDSKVIDENCDLNENNHCNELKDETWEFTLDDYSDDDDYDPSGDNDLDE